jgi:hypothetical protein
MEVIAKYRSKEEFADAVIELIKSNIEPVEHLPRCEHNSPLSDWSGEWLQPDCGCNFDTVDDKTKKVMEMLKMQGKGIENA